MAPTLVTRPLWRSFAPRFLERAAAHVRRGGHAAVIADGPAGRIDLFFPVDGAGAITELGLWSLLAIEQRRWRRVRGGAAKGLATARAKPAFAEVVLDWCLRDSVHPGSTRGMGLDCVACAACCRDADVVLEPKDLVKWREAGRHELLRREHLRRARDGKVRLRLSRDGGCHHLGADRRCRIYALRPSNCAAFLAGSEACLAAREDTLGWRDG